MKQVYVQKEFQALKILHILIGLCILFSGYFISSPEFFVTPSEKLLSMGFSQVGDKIRVSFSQVGMIIIGIFLGTIYLWTFVNTFWPSFLGILLLGCSPYAPMSAVLSSFLGTPMVVLIFFLFLFATVLVRSQVAVYIARWLMTRPIVDGRPWVLITMLFFTTYCVAFFEQTTSVFLMWPVAYTIFKEVGYQKGDRLVSFVVVAIAIIAMLSFATDALKGGAFYLVASLHTYGEIAGQVVEPMNLVLYICFSLLLSFIVMTIMLFIMRFLYRVDVSALKNFNRKSLNANPLPPMQKKQKFALFLFGLYALILVLAAVLPQDTILGVFLRANQVGATLFIVFILVIVSFDGEPMLDMSKVMGSYPWTVFFLIATAFTFGTAITHESTNFSIVMESILNESCSVVDYCLFIIGIVIMAFCITNFTNSVVAGLIFAPIIIALCNGFCFSYLPVLACFYFTVLIAACTPAASPFAALLYANKDWIDTKDIIHYTLLMSFIVLLVVICVGIPLSIMIF